ncbi:SusD/RagB family nutrient-binding outer membrane lipoprotein [Flavobacterium sp. W22_SRS_FP1]|uniref:SusD/RagB family nutrient-binding outer membrane lipoprotein n=1 Tax=Flavobacterium sp. W22_SRS_FP1 TaxID=3240276 RepID=UPI003F9071F1
MKYKYKLILKSLVIVLSLSLLTTSCSEWIDHELNTDPDSPSNVPMGLLLPSVQQSMGYHLLGNNTVRTNNIWMQQFDGVDRQSFTEARYQHTPADVTNIWNPIYTEMLINLHLIIEKGSAAGNESPNFVGVAQVLEATTLGIATDLFGDMPYTEGLKGFENVLKPKYDSQEVIYDNIFMLLDNAVSNLDNTSNVLKVTGDAIYGGTISKWKKAAYSIKARHELQLSKKNGTAAYTAALAAAAKGFASNADDFLVSWEAANKNPINQFMTQRGDIRMGATLINMLSANEDPRIAFYASKDGDGNYTGSIAGSQNADASKPGTYNSAETSKTILMSYSELKFIEAEAYLGLGQTALAQSSYEAAVAASVLKVTGAANTAWLDANINDVPVTLKNIIEQKYIAGYSTNQPYADYRRTGFPVLPLAVGAVIPAIPTRFPYSQDELDYNKANVPSVTISDKVWWNQ